MLVTNMCKRQHTTFYSAVTVLMHALDLACVCVHVYARQQGKVVKMQSCVPLVYMIAADE